ncbi:2-oxoacid ferredoxin oxidoreductase [archaeon]|nr:2-oxoacid ferredoxin oxidoreductase [archaeon]
MSLDTWNKPNWCPGCGNFGIWNALKLAIEDLKLTREEVVMTGGIGCSSKIPYWVNVNAFCGLHGRPVSLAAGIKLMNPKLTVIACGGDGDGYSEGVQHFIHFCKDNFDIAYFIHNNQIYGLTKGQASPTSDEGFITKTTPWGAFKALNPVSTALGAGATFVARGFAGDMQGLKGLMKKAIKHKGAALVDILQPCVTFNKKNTFAWYKERIYELKKPFKTRAEAFKESLKWGDKIPIGVFYQSKEKTMGDHLPKPGKVKKRSIGKLLKELM